MKPTRRSQPYRKGRARLAGPALFNMLAGRTASGGNPMDPMRQAAKNARKRKRGRSVRMRRNTTYRVR